MTYRFISSGKILRLGKRIKVRGLEVGYEVHCPKDLIEWANSDSAIQWFLYDANLLPEQIDTEKKLCALRGFQFGWKSAMAAMGNPAVPKKIYERM